VQAEILIDGVSSKGQRILRAMAEASPIKAVITDRYRGDADVLMLWGSRRIDHKAIWRRHRENGRCIGWDLGYWDRTESMRVHIDHQHPTADQLALAVGDRREFSLREDSSKNGPVMLVGIGEKSKAAMGSSAWEAWELSALKRIRSEIPLSRVVRRPKLKGQPPIEQALKGCRLVVCSHSNVAVDACVAGVPVWCDDGAAFALYRNNENPSKGERLEFLRQLAWFNWRPNEAGEAWKFLLKVCAST
jgi:hypothetical protein